MTPTRRSPLLAAVVVATVAVAVAGPASAHTVTDLVAVPAGSTTMVSLQPTHGCGQSPTVAVSIRARVRGATAGEVEGWTATALEDEDGTVLEWSGGVLPADAAGRFPVGFTAPDTPGELLTFPALQRCENGEELAWIGGDPAGEQPAPRVLVLPAGSRPAATVDDVPADAPGREQLVDIVDVDHPEADAGSSSDAGSSADGSATSTPAPADGDRAAGQAAQPAGAPQADGGDGDDGGSATAVGVALVVVALAAGAGAVALRRRSSQRR